MYASETAAEQFTRTILNLTDAGQPITSDNVALCFKSHGQCANVNSIPGNSAVILRNDSDAFTIQLLFDKHDPTIVIGWRYETHTPGLIGRRLITSEGRNGDWKTIAHDIATTVSAWLEQSPIPDKDTIRDDVDDLKDALKAALYCVDTEVDPDGTPYVTVDLDDKRETTVEIHTDYIYGSYTVYFTNKNGDPADDEYTTIDELIEGLIKLGAAPRT